MAKSADDGAAGDPLTPATSREDWDAQGWAAEPTPFAAAPRLETTVSIRFDPENARLLRRAARLSGWTKSEFIRRAALREARAVVGGTAQNPLVVRSVTRMAPPMTGSSGRHGTRQGVRTEPVPEGGGVRQVPAAAVSDASYVSGITVQVDGAMTTAVP